MKKYGAELIGAFGLTFAVLMSMAGRFPVPTAVIAALTLGLFVYSLGHVSGGHFNPAVTIGLWSIKKITLNDAVMYLVAQFVGALVALFLANTLGLGPLNSATATWQVGVAELIGAFFFTFGVASVATGKAPKELSGVVVAGSLLLGISIAAIGSNGILNPAVALGTRSFSLMYLLGPIVGSVIGMNLFKWVAVEK